jgi:drug/metabolite transporter (DMT)-like permease
MGAILQKAVTAEPAEVLPLQYSMSLMLCIVILPFEPLTLSFDLGFLVPLLWLGLIISVVAQLLFYRLIRTSNLVNVTSLFYLVPVVTAALDYLLHGNRPGPLSLTGMGAILVGLWLVFKVTGARIQELGGLRSGHGGRSGLSGPQSLRAPNLSLRSPTTYNLLLGGNYSQTFNII